jgi:hypothetical protein
MQNLWRENFESEDLPAWRKVLIAFFFVLLFVVGYMPFAKNTDIYTTAPSRPMPETKQVIPVHVNHGYLRYVTEKEAQDLRYWDVVSPDLIGGLLLGIVALILTYRIEQKT